jgi:hypothetical protein
MCRGDRRENIFLNDVDRHDFIKTLAKACQKTQWQASSVRHQKPPGHEPVSCHVTHPRENFLTKISPPNGKILFLTIRTV